jgi:translation initiation factor IF-2
MGIDVKSHASSLTDRQVEQVQEKYGKKPPPPSEFDLAPPPRRGPLTRTPAPEPAAPPPPEPPPAETEAEASAPAEAPETEAPADEEEPPAEEADSKTITLKGPVIVREFAEMLGLKPNQLIAGLMSMNVFASINEKIEVKMAQQLAAKHGYTVEQEKKKKEVKQPPPKPKQETPEVVEDKPEQMRTRPPVVTFLGHVDHGKTSLLDRIRKARVAKGEHGGITQHIGAYTVTHHDQDITFLDTPGHAAFTAMRARGANLTDIAVIIIAADDGIMPQTREAIQHAKAAGVTVMVAINKIDLPRANVDRVKQQLQQEDLTSEDWGGETVCCPVSAETGEGIDSLLEMILLQAEMLELSANPSRKAKGFVVEAKLEPGMGPTANILVKNGTLKVGDAIVCGRSWGKIKALINDKGNKVRSAGPSTPVKCLGLTSVPDAGQEFTVYPNAKQAKAEGAQRVADVREALQAEPARKVSLDDLLSATDPTSVLELPVIIKTDVQGSTEALKHSLEEIQSDKIKLKVLLSGVGNITTNDVLLASASSAIILGFHVAKENGVVALATREGVEVRLYNVIYELLDDVRDAMTGMLAPDEKEKILGQAQVRQIFELSNKQRVAGCMIVKGRVNAKSRIRVRRGGGVMFEGRITNLKRFQSDANEVREGQECGIRIDGFKGIEIGDVIETYEIEKVAAQL